MSLTLLILCSQRALQHPARLMIVCFARSFGDLEQTRRLLMAVAVNAKENKHLSCSLWQCADGALEIDVHGEPFADERLVGFLVVMPFLTTMGTKNLVDRDTV